MTFKEVMDLYVSTDSTQREIAEATELPKSTVARALNCEKCFLTTSYGTILKITTFLETKHGNRDVYGRVC